MPALSSALPSQADLDASLREAARDGNCARIRLAVMSGADIESRDEQERTALNIATQYGHAEAAITLIAARQAARLLRMGLNEIATPTSVVGRKVA